MTRYKDPGDPGSSTTVVHYPLETMREAGAKIVIDAENALTTHNAHWRKVQDFISRFPGFIQGTILAALTPYESRLRASYQWQMDYGTALFETADLMDTADQGVSQRFQPKGFDHGPKNAR